MTNIIHTNGSIQLNTPYTTDEELQSCGLTDWRIATDDEVNAWKSANAEKIKQEHNQAVYNQLMNLDGIAGVRIVRETLLLLGQNGAITAEYPNGKIKDVEAQAEELRNQLQ